VLAVKAAQVTATDQFRTGYTLRFPRFKKLRLDRDWQSALSLSGFNALKSNVEKEQKEKKFKVDDHRRKRQTVPRKKAMTVAGNDLAFDRPYAGRPSDIFAGLNFCRSSLLNPMMVSADTDPDIMTDAIRPKKNKADLAHLVQANGGKLHQKSDACPDTICIGDKREYGTLRHHVWHSFSW